MGGKKPRLALSYEAHKALHFSTDSSLRSLASIHLPLSHNPELPTIASRSACNYRAAEHFKIKLESKYLSGLVAINHHQS